jgi:hypothetical protein
MPTSDSNRADKTRLQVKRSLKILGKMKGFHEHHMRDVCTIIHSDHPRLEPGAWGRLLLPLIQQRQFNRAVNFIGCLYKSHLVDWNQQLFMYGLVGLKMALDGQDVNEFMGRHVHQYAIPSIFTYADREASLQGKYGGAFQGMCTMQGTTKQQSVVNSVLVDVLLLSGGHDDLNCILQLLCSSQELLAWSFATRIVAINKRRDRPSFYFAPHSLHALGQHLESFYPEGAASLVVDLQEFFTLSSGPLSRQKHIGEYHSVVSMLMSRCVRYGCLSQAIEVWKTFTERTSRHSLPHTIDTALWTTLLGLLHKLKDYNKAAQVLDAVIQSGHSLDSRVVLFACKTYLKLADYDGLAKVLRLWARQYNVTSANTQGTDESNDPHHLISLLHRLPSNFRNHEGVIHALCDADSDPTQQFLGHRVFHDMLTHGHRPTLPTLTIVLQSFQRTRSFASVADTVRSVLDSDYVLDAKFVNVAVSALLAARDLHTSRELMAQWKQQGTRNANTHSDTSPTLAHRNFATTMFRLLTRPSSQPIHPNRISELADSLLFFDHHKPPLWNHPPDIILYSTVLQGLLQNHNYDRSLSLFDKLLSTGPAPTLVTFSIMIDNLLHIATDPNLWAFWKHTSTPYSMAYKYYREMLVRGIQPDHALSKKIALHVLKYKHLRVQYRL